MRHRHRGRGQLPRAVGSGLRSAIARRFPRSSLPARCTNTSSGATHGPRVSLVVEAGDVREPHHVALLIGFGAAAVNPYLAMETVEEMATRGFWAT